jgi:modulator of FtsH protease
MTLFSIIWGLILINLKNYVPKEVIKTALFSSLGIFISIFIFGVLLVAFGVYLDYRFAFVLLALLLLLIITTIVLRLMDKYYTVHKSMVVITIILFTLFIIYETNDILYRDSRDVISASMDYYLDIMNIFMSIINYQM